MSLRSRVALLVGLVLLTGLAAGALLAVQEARKTLAAELGTGLRGAETTVRAAFEDLPRSDHPQRDLRQLIAVFDGARHVRASLVDDAGRTLLASRVLKPEKPAPAWFADRLGPAPAGRAVAVPTDPRLRVFLQPVKEPDAAAVWAEFAAVLSAMSVAAAAALGLTWVLIGTALRPLRELADGMARVGGGDYAARSPAFAPTDLAALERGFNAMAERLAGMSERNRVLERQILSLQDEERAEIARDLHDEFGPHLFALAIDARTVRQAAEAGTVEGVAERADAIGAAASRLQRQVREMITRLRPARVTELGLEAAVRDLLAFWRARRPDVLFEARVEIDEAATPDALTDTVYRVVQEGLSNAARHARATRVDVEVSSDGEAVTVAVRDDGTGTDAGLEPGFGLIGMRERVAACGGAFAVERENGWAVTARLPLPPPAPEGSAAPLRSARS